MAFYGQKAYNMRQIPFTWATFALSAAILSVIYASENNPFHPHTHTPKAQLIVSIHTSLPGYPRHIAPY